MEDKRDSAKGIGCNEAGKFLLPRSCLEAFRFLTAVPLPSARRGSEDRLASSVAWFPLVGGALGGLLVIVDWASGRAFTHQPSFLTSALLLLTYALFTGGLHHDGLLDTADAFWGRRSREERLRIMKDSRAGALGVTALILFLLAELAVLYALPAASSGTSGGLRQAALFSFPVLGRWSMSYLCLRFPYARAEGTGAAMVGKALPRHFLISTFLTLSALVFSFTWLVNIPMLIPVLILYTLALAELLGGYFSRSLGGITGDVIGATGMLCEAFVLLLLASRVPLLLPGG
ncbi:MAG: adenosylcobinamide-GDP ribazoletransferase [Actinomycetota bacterium]|nr:adenosylcobinamide-GDP ribazoletransferase [Actinomycetota bacterium]